MVSTLVQWFLVAANLGGGVVAVLLGLYAWRRRDTPSAKRYAHVMAVAGPWCFGYGLMLVSPTAGIARAFELVAIGFALVSVFVWLTFVIEYTGKGHWLTLRNQALIWAVPVLYYPLLVTNPLHGIVRSTTVVEYGSLMIVWDHPKTIEYAVMVYSLLAVFAGLFLLTRFLVSTRNIYRKQTSMILLSTLLIALVYIAYTLGISIHPGFNPSSLFFLAEAALVGVALFRYDFLDVSPIATELYLERMADPLLVFDEKRRLVDFNDAAKTVLPLTEDDVGVSAQTIHGGLAGAVAADEPEAGTLAVDRNDGTNETVEPRVTTVEDQYGTDRGTLVVLRNVTDRIQREHELREKNEELERFTGIVAHDIRNPLTVAKGYAQLGKTSGKETHIQKSIEAMDRMENLVEDLLTLAREGKRVDDPESVDLGGVVRSAWTEIGTDAAELEVVDTRSMLADPLRFRELLGNLFRNSIEHGTTDGHARTSVTVRVGVTDDGFFVEDTGPGIPEDDRETVFEMGYTSSEQGTGFGLAIVDAIAEAHGWEVAVTDGSDGGARFDFSGVDESRVATEPNPPTQ